MAMAGGGKFETHQSGDEQVVVVEALKGDTELQLQQNIQSNYLQEISPPLPLGACAPLTSSQGSLCWNIYDVESLLFDSLLALK